jgi:hypothetical protein
MNYVFFFEVVVYPSTFLAAGPMIASKIPHGIYKSRYSAPKDPLLCPNFIDKSSYL